MAAFGFSRARRLLTAADFNRVFTNAQWRASNKAMLLLAAKNNLAQSRIGFVIAKKNVRTAIQRNRTKRVIRNYFRTHPNLCPSVDIVVIARRGLEQLDNREICDTFAHLCSKMKCQH